MDFAAKLRNVYAFFVPFVCADKAQKLVERQQKRRVVRLGVHIGKGGADIGRARVA